VHDTALPGRQPAIPGFGQVAGRAPIGFVLAIGPAGHLSFDDVGGAGVCRLQLPACQFYAPMLWISRKLVHVLSSPPAPSTRRRASPLVAGRRLAGKADPIRASVRGQRPRPTTTAYAAASAASFCGERAAAPGCRCPRGVP
jgi:hypothetical protein